MQWKYKRENEKSNNIKKICLYNNTQAMYLWLGTLRDGMLAVEDNRKKSAEEPTGNWLEPVFVGHLFTPKYWELELLTEATRQNWTKNVSQEPVLVQFSSGFFWFWEPDYQGTSLGTLYLVYVFGSPVYSLSPPYSPITSCTQLQTAVRVLIFLSECLHSISVLPWG